MFFKVNLVKNIFVPPEMLGANLIRDLETLLRSAVVGKKVPKVGLVLEIIDILTSSGLEGKVLDTGEVRFAVTYSALLFRALPRECIDVVVSDVLAEGFIGNAGPIDIFIPQLQMSRFTYETDSVHAHFISMDGKRTISLGDVCRVRVLAETANPRFQAVGTIDINEVERGRLGDAHGEVRDALGPR